MKTAVEFLVKEINKLTGLTIEMDEPCVEQAKEMEKVKIINTLIEFSKAHFDIHTEEAILNITRRAEKYYKETFKQQEQ